MAKVVASEKGKSVAAPARGMTAEQIIARREREEALKDLPCEEALSELKKLMDKNDARGGTHRRYTADEGMELLKSWGWVGARSRFDRLLRAQFGRGWLK